MNYIDFLKHKMAVSHETGFEVSSNELTESFRILVPKFN